MMNERMPLSLPPESFGEGFLSVVGKEGLSRSKREILEDNARKLALDLSRERLEFESLPFLIEFSANNACNLQCVMCESKDQKHRSIPTETIEKVIIPQVFPHAISLTPSAGSEPFLGKIGLLGEGCRAHEVQLNIITNGTLITAERLEHLSPVIGRMQISLDGHHKALYESIRVGADFRSVVEKVELAAAYANGTPGFRLLLSAVFSAELARDLAGFVRFASDLGADGAVIQKMMSRTSTASRLDAFRVLDDGEISAAKGDAVKAAEEAGIDLCFEFNPPEAHPFNRRRKRPFHYDHMVSNLHAHFPEVCFMAATYVKISPEGSVYPCCASGIQLNMGNIKGRPFRSIWNGRKYRGFRRKMFRRTYPSVCRSCPVIKRGAWQGEQRSSRPSLP